MLAATSMSTHPDAAFAVGEIVGDVLEQLGGEPRVVIVFITRHHVRSMPLIVEAIHQLLHPTTLLGTTAASVLGGSLDSEGRPGIAVWASTHRESAAIRLIADPEDPRRISITGPVGDTELTAHPAVAAATMLIVLSDPFSFPTRTLVSELSLQYPGLKVVGGVASAATTPGGNKFAWDHNIASDGAVGLLLNNVDVSVVVAKASEPIGDPMTVTAASGTTLVELAGKPALDRLTAAITQTDLPASSAVEHIELGVVVDHGPDEIAPSDFAIVDLVSIDANSRVLRLGSAIDVGTTVQFHLRSTAAAAANLWPALSTGPGGGSMLAFISARRAESLSRELSADAVALAEWAGGPLIAGMATMGEIGPVGNKKVIHTYAAAIALFREYDN